MRLREDASDGDLTDHLVNGEHHARPDRTDPVSGEQAFDPPGAGVRTGPPGRRAGVWSVSV
ncbi:hypothetical protein ABZ622_40785 [Streptomyces sp. NPDC007164]|uniref:hypothetical protein n=1 Tax=Streptomyces sp. NPDC007164 TaxID=3156918 RepID=UPI0033E4F795